MEIYKRGQGVWARSLAILVFLFFGAWGVREIYRIPAEMNVIVIPDDVIWERTAKRLLRAGKTSIKVKGLANQPVSEDLLKPGIKPAYRIENPAGHGIVLETETFDRDKLKKLEEEKIRFVPVMSGDKMLDAVKVNEWLVGRTIAQTIHYKDEILFEKTKKGEPLDPALVQDIREKLKDFPLALVGPLFKTQEDLDGGRALLTVPAEKVLAGMVPGDVLKAGIQRLACEEGKEIDREVFELLKKLSAAGKIPGNKVRIRDEGYLRVEAGNIEEIGGRYLISRRNELMETWWSKKIFVVPLLKFDVTPGICIGVGLLLGMGSLVVYSWNLKRWNDLLIDTQTEMKKVSWPSRSELVGSSVVVIVCVLVLGVYLYVMDLLLTKLADQAGLLR